MIEESQHAKTIGMLESLSQAPVFLVPMDDVHLKRQSHVIEGVLRSSVVLVTPVEVQSLDFVFVVKRTSEDVWETKTFLFLFRTVLRDR